MKKILLSVFILLSALFPSLLKAQWSPRVKLSIAAVSASLNENMGPCLAAKGDTLHVVWCDHRASGSSIWYRHSLDNGLTWSGERPITDTSGTATFPAVAVSGSIVHVVWMEQISGVNASFYKRSLDNGITWTPKFCLDSVTKFWPGVSAAGPLVVVSLNKEIVTGNTEVFFRRSTNNGTAWDSIQRISNATGRSEDPAINVQGMDIHLSWNDNRSGTMNIWYRHSPDAGMTWDAETQLTNATGANTAYTSMVSLNGPNVDVPYGYQVGGKFDVWLRQSADGGATWTANPQLTNDTMSEAYAFMARSGMDLHLVFSQFGLGPKYLHSADGGVTWDPAFFLGFGSQPFISISGCVLNVIYADSGAVYYRRNPNGNCTSTTGVLNPVSSNDLLNVYPNPSHGSFTINAQWAGDNGQLKIVTVLGEEVFHALLNSKHQTLNPELAAGFYFVKVSDGEKELVQKLVVQ